MMITKNDSRFQAAAHVSAPIVALSVTFAGTAG